MASWEVDERKVWGIILDLKRRVQELEKKVNVGQAKDYDNSQEERKR